MGYKLRVDFLIMISPLMLFDENPANYC